MADDDQQPKQQQQQPQGKLCPKCSSQPRLTHSILETRTGKTVRLYHCQCGERIWDD